MNDVIAGDEKELIIRLVELARMLDKVKKKMKRETELNSIIACLDDIIIDWIHKKD